MSRLLLCTDLDRTLLPNGTQPESPGARRLFARLAAHPGVTVAYVTGRDAALADEAVAVWRVPVPDVLIGDVGTTVASRRGGRWERWSDWDARLSADWRGGGPAALQTLLADLEGLALQDAARQGRFKLSYTTPVEPAGPALAETVRRRLTDAGVRANVVWSVDEAADLGLLDVLPGAATKRLAVEFVMAAKGFAPDEVLCAGDSGNDLDMLTGGLPAVLVANARDEVRAEARRLADAAGHGPRLHEARGGALGLSGNYAGGILEGVLHHHPSWAAVLEQEDP